LVTEGNLERFMPPFSSLSDRERWDVVAYAYTLNVSEEMISLGETIYQENCAACHGNTGQGDGALASGLSTPPTDFTNQAFMALISDGELFDAITFGLPPEMPAFDEKFSQDERWALSAYLRQLSFDYSTQVDLPESTMPTEEMTDSLETSTPLPDVSPTEEVVIDGSGNIFVEVINGSGRELPPELEVTLYGFDNMQIVLTETRTSMKDGFYVFRDIDMPHSRAFVAGVDYAGSTYGSDIAVVETIPTTITLGVTIFETSTDTSLLTTDRMHIFFDFTEPDSVQVVELYIMSNPSDQTIVASEEGGPILQFTLPEGATNLEFQDGALGERYLHTADGFADTLPVAPGLGEYQVLFAYDMPYDRKADLIQNIDLPTDAVVILLPDVGVKVKSDMLEDNGIRDVQGVAYRMYSGNNLSAGSQLTMNLSGKPNLGAPTIPTSDSKTELAIGLGVFGVALIAAGAWLYFRNKTRYVDEDEIEVDAADEAEFETSAAFEDADTVMDAIIALDDQYQTGNLPEGAYRKRRAELKEKLSELIDEQEES
jgi:hypothetical protein